MLFFSETERPLVDPGGSLEPRPPHLRFNSPSHPYLLPFLAPFLFVLSSVFCLSLSSAQCSVHISPLPCRI